MAVQWHQPFVRARWEARFVLAGFSLGIVGLVGTTLAMILRGAPDGWAMSFFLIASIGALLLTIVLFRVSKRVLGSYYPLWRPLSSIRLGLRFLGRAPSEAGRMLDLPDSLARILVFALPLAYFSLVVLILLWPISQ